MRIGILTLNTGHDIELGNVQHARSFDFPVAYAVVNDVSLPDLMQGSDQALPPILAGIRALEELGVDFIVGACGSFGHYQKSAAAASAVPVCLSPLMQVPLLLATLPAHLKLGVIFARTLAFTSRVKEQCGISDDSRIVAIGADALPAFAPILDPTLPLDGESLETQLLDLAVRVQRDDGAIGAWLLQCSDLPPYSAALAAETGLPVFDMVALVRHFADALDPLVFRSAPTKALSMYKAEPHRGLR